MSNPAATPEERAHTCDAMLGSIQMYGNAGDLNMADRFYGSICNMYKQFSTESPLRDALAKGAVAMTYYYGRSGELDQANEFIDDLRALRGETPGEEQLGDLLADALSTQAIHYSHRQEFQKVYEIYCELRALAAEVPTRVFVQEQFASAAYNLSVGLHSLRAVDDMYILHRELAALSARVPASAEIRMHVSRLGFNLSTMLLRENPAESQVLCEQLRGIAQAHPGEPALWQPAAMGACNLATQFAVLGRLSEALRQYDELAEWAERQPDNAHIREQRARTARNILIMSDRGWDRAEGWRLYRDSVSAVATDPENASLREWAGECAHAIWLDAVTRGDVGRAELAFLELAGLVNQYPADPHLREYLDKIRRLREKPFT